MEAEFLAWLRCRLPPYPGLELGLGDDAALVCLAGDPRAVLTVDLLTDGVDFELGKTSASRIGRKALAVNLSDMAAMAAQPLAALVALALPRRGGLQLAKDLYEGLLPLAENYQVAIAGGDTNSWDGPLVVSITLVGQLTPLGPLKRQGARPGDSIVVTGAFGGSILGRHFDFEPRVGESMALLRDYPLQAGIDSSDGLSLDLWRLAEASGCGAVLDTSAIPVAPAAFELAGQLNDGSTALDHALSDGEDFELILAVPPESAEVMIARQPLACPLSCIGHFVPQKGLWQRDAAGELRPLVPRGFEH